MCIIYMPYLCRPKSLYGTFRYGTSKCGRDRYSTGTDSGRGGQDAFIHVVFISSSELCCTYRTPLPLMTAEWVTIRYLVPLPLRVLGTGTVSTATNALGAHVHGFQLGTALCVSLGRSCGCASRLDLRNTNFRNLGRVSHSLARF